MFVIGLTGGIGTGKSTVAEVLGEQGLPVLSADLVGHEVYLPGRPGYHEIIDAWPEVKGDDGTIDRKKLGAIVFGDPKELARLNSITHPRMKGMMREKLVEIEKTGATVAVLEAALLLEARWDDLADEIWVTAAPPEIAAHRVAERNKMDEQQVMERIRAQMSTEDRVKRADHVIDTSGDMDQTRRQTLECWKALQGRLP
ncbi:MAG: dephospho-CoA kinase [Chloroflexota bacterium]